jgi:tryptophan halogenase
MKRRLGVIGVGSAGILSLCHFITHLDNAWEVVSISDPNTKILGIGESSNPSFITALETATDFNLHDDISALDATHKFGTMWKRWRDNDFLGPLLGGSCAMHFNNFKLKDLIIPRLLKKWPNKFSQLSGHVDELVNMEGYVNLVLDGINYEFDYIIDCRGFPTDMTDYHMCEDIPVNRALIHNIEQPGDWKYTGHRAHRNGWMFEIPLTSRCSYGYLFNDTVTPIDEAKADFSNEIGVSVDKLQDIEYKFQSYYSTKVLDGRIMKNGNRAIFFEPISATSIYMYDQANKIFFNYIIGHFKSEQETNDAFVEVSQAIEELIYWFYHGGSVYDTPFWQKVKSTLPQKVKASKMMRDLIPSFKKWNAVGTPVHAQTWFFAPHLMSKLDRDFKYNYLQ